MKPAIIALISLLTLRSYSGELFSTVTANAALGANSDSGNTVYALMVSTPISESISLGLIGANDGGRWVAGAATVNLGKEWLLTDKLGVNANIGSGMGVDLFTHRPTAYSFFDVGGIYHVSRNLSVGVSGVVANVADRSGVDILGAASVSWKF